MSSLQLTRLRGGGALGGRIARVRTVNGRDLALGGWTVLVYVFLFAPIVTMVLFSFNTGVLGRQTGQFIAFTTQWYSTAWHDPQLRHSLFISLEVAGCSALISTALGTIVGLVLARQRSALVRRGLEALVYFMIIVPEVVFGLAMLIFLTRAGVQLNLLTLIAGHTPFGIAIATLIVRSRAVALDRSIEEAVTDLGAGRWRTFVDAILPQLWPALIAALILTATFSWDDVVTSSFLTTPTVTTLPVYIFGEVHTGVTPEVFAVATMMLAVTLLGLSAAAFVLRNQLRAGQV